MPDIIRTARWLGIAAFVATYAALVHRVNVSGPAGMLGALLAAMPLFAIGLALAWSFRARLAGLLLLAVSGIIFWAAWPAIARHSGFLFWMQDAGLLLTLLFTFGRTLLAGRQPLCVAFAEMVHGPLTPVHERYAQRVTVTWTVFFGVMAATSTVLFFLAPLAVWSVFANFLVLPLVALMFVAEYLVRRRVLTGMASGRMFDAVQAYLKSSARTH